MKISYALLIVAFTLPAFAADKKTNASADRFPAAVSGQFFCASPSIQLDNASGIQNLITTNCDVSKPLTTSFSDGWGKLLICCTKK